MMKQKIKILQFISNITIIAGLITIIPDLSGNKSILGYNSVCSFAPISSVIMVYTGWMIKGYLKSLSPQK